MRVGCLRHSVALSAATLLFGAAPPAFALANRVFVSARTGNNANSCDNILTPCQTLAGAVAQINPGGEVIVLDSGGYGPVTITKGVTIEAPPGVTAFIHPPSGDAITVSAGSTDVVTLKGLVLNGGSGNGITLTSVGTLNVVNLSISGFGNGIETIGTTNARMVLKGTDITACANGVLYANTGGVLQASIDHCHFDGNANGFFAATTAPTISKTSATNSTANNNTGDGWICGGETTGGDDLILEACAGSENGAAGIVVNGVASHVYLSNCTFTANGQNDVVVGLGMASSRVNNTMLTEPTSAFFTFLPK